MSDDMSEIKRVEQKIDEFKISHKEFKDSQREFNNLVSANLEKLTDMVAVTQVQQVEINNIATNVNMLTTRLDKQGEDIGNIKINQALTAEFKKEARQLKWVSIGMLVSILVYIIKESL